MSKDLGRLRDDGGFELRTSAFARLRAQEVQRVGLQAAAVRTPFHAVAVRERVQGRVGETIEASGGKIVIIERSDGVSAVPWSRTLENLRGRDFRGHGARGWFLGACGGCSGKVCRGPPWHSWLSSRAGARKASAAHRSHVPSRATLPSCGTGDRSSRPAGAGSGVPRFADASAYRQYLRWLQLAVANVKQLERCRHRSHIRCL